MRILIFAGLLSGLTAMAADDSARLISVDHYLNVKSPLPSVEGQTAQLYLREVVLAGPALRGGAGKVVLFVHGAGTPAEVGFDVPHQDFSWMGYLARNGFDVFSVDMIGYGRSTRPPLMADTCNLSTEQQTALGLKPCAATSKVRQGSVMDEWKDIDAAVDYLRNLRRVDKVNLVAWSQGGPRAGGYASQHPEKVARVAILAPAYDRAMPAAQTINANAVLFNTQSRADFDTNWDRQVGCVDQYDPATSHVVWSEMLASDPVGATWGPGVRRAPSVASAGWGQTTVAKMTTPVLMVAGIHDKQVPPERVRELYADLGSSEKIFVDLACSSHNAMWERNHLLLFRATQEWLDKGTVNGEKLGMLKLGY
jgi:pimeloyl-ACP methyl ester carboxylesterase